MSAPDNGIASQLEKQVENLLNGCIGASPLPRKRSRPSRLPEAPWVQGVIAGLGYAFLFCIMPLAFLRVFDQRPERHLLLFSIYGSLYFAWATIIARYTSAKLLGIVKEQVVPALSAEGASRICANLDERFSERRISVISWLSALAGAGAAAWAIHHDVGSFPLQIFWWSLGWFALFLTAARTTFVGRFYACFADQIENEQIYVPDPAQSVLINGVAAIGRAMLVFWLGILASITLLIPVASLADDELKSPQWYEHINSTFVWLVVPITSLFSIPFGTLVYLNSEKTISKVVKKNLRATKLSIEREIGPLFGRRMELGEADLTRMGVLSTIHSRLATSGGYKSALTIGLSLLIPLIGPVTAIAKLILDQKH